MATAKTVKTKAAPAGPADKGLRIVSRSDQGFRRCGRFFGPEGVTLPLSELTEDEVETLREERQLVVVDVDLPKAAEA